MRAAGCRTSELVDPGQDCLAPHAAPHGRSSRADPLKRSAGDFLTSTISNSLLDASLDRVRAPSLRSPHQAVPLVLKDSASAVQDFLRTVHNREVSARCMLSGREGRAYKEEHSEIEGVHQGDVAESGSLRLINVSHAQLESLVAYRF